jgi:hypothetical protein
MSVHVIDKKIIGSVRGKVDLKYKYRIQYGDDKLIALNWKDLAYPIVYDDHLDGDMDNLGWFCNCDTYVCNRSTGMTMHQYVFQLSDKVCDQGQTIDHINRYKTDNRLVNLRAATNSEQISNRASRSDKIPPFPELQEIGVTEYPRHVRWDKSEKKFVIEKHPVLLREVQDGKRKKPSISGSKSANITVLDKYKDILARLRELDDQTDHTFKAIREARKHEFEEIVRAIKAYDGVTEEPVETTVCDITPERRTAEGRKKPSSLPEGCGVTVDMIPKHCWYRPESDTRGDAFLLSHHPALGKKGWSTTSSKSVSTLDKYNMLVEKLQLLTTDSN